MVDGGRARAKLARYALAAFGPIAVAGSQFLLALLMLQALTPAAFGAFTFLLVLFQFASGLWSALFCAPLPALLQERPDAEPGSIQTSLGCMAFAAALPAGGLFWCAGVLLGLGHVASGLFALHAAAGLWRWFLRSEAYAEGAQARTALSDAVYGGVLSSAVILIWHGGSVTVVSGAAALLAAGISGLLAFGATRLRRHAAPPNAVDRSLYRDVWGRHARWSLVGVATTEATANAHAYLVTAAAGPAAYAPLAASALLVRPIGVLMNALGEFERAQMAKQLASGSFAGALRSAALFRFALLSGWAATAAGAWLLLSSAPSLLFPPQKYETGVIAAAAALWIALALVRVVRLPESVLMQAAGAFQPLARASIASCGLSISAAAALLFSLGPLWSMVGVLAGEMLFAVMIWRAAKALIEDRRR